MNDFLENRKIVRKYKSSTQNKFLRHRRNIILSANLQKLATQIQTMQVQMELMDMAFQASRSKIPKILKQKIHPETTE